MFFLLLLLVCNIWESPQEKRSLREGEYTDLKGVKCDEQAEPGILDPASTSSAALTWLPSICLVPAAFSCLHNCSWLLCSYSDTLLALNCLWSLKVASSSCFSVFSSSFSYYAAKGYGQKGPGFQMCPKQILSQQTFFSGQTELAKHFFPSHISSSH